MRRRGWRGLSWIRSSGISIDPLANQYDQATDPREHGDEQGQRGERESEHGYVALGSPRLLAGGEYVRNGRADVPRTEEYDDGGVVPQAVRAIRAFDHATRTSTGGMSWVMGGRPARRRNSSASAR